MKIKNKSTKKEYPISKAEWDKMPKEQQDKFTVVDATESNTSVQEVKNEALKEDKKENKETKPNIDKP